MWLLSKRFIWSNWEATPVLQTQLNDEWADNNPERIQALENQLRYHLNVESQNKTDRIQALENQLNVESENAERNLALENKLNQIFWVRE